MWDYIIYGSAVSAGFLFIFNNYCKNIMKSSCLDYCKKNRKSSCLDYCKNKYGWGLFKIYAVNKRRCLAINSRFKCQFTKPKLHDNILFIKDGLRKENVRIHENTKLIKDIIERNEYNLVLYRTISKHVGIEYDIIRLCEKDINSILTLKDDEDFVFDYSESNCAIINPVLQIENIKGVDNTDSNIVADATADSDECKSENDNNSNCSESSNDSSKNREVYELMLERDNYLIVGNKIFDFPFIKWFLREQYTKNIEDDQEYNIFCFDGNINQFSIDQTQCFIIEDKTITPISTIVEKEKIEEDPEEEESKKVIEKAKSWSYFTW